jgi:hypothetical protein
LTWILWLAASCCCAAGRAAGVAAAVAWRLRGCWCGWGVRLYRHFIRVSAASAAALW